MSEFEQVDQPQSDDDKFRTELLDARVSQRVVEKIIRLKNDISLKLYSKEIEAARKIKVASAGEIPAKFAGQEISGRAAIRRIMFVALINGVLRRDTPFRRLWYQFVKASLQGIATEFAMSSAFYNSMSNLVKETGLDYKDFGIINLGEVDEETGKRQLARGLYEVYSEGSHKFPNVMLGIEDASYYSVFKNMAKLLGLHRYSASGQSSLSSTEVITDDLKEKVNVREDYPLHIRSITDYDPAGFNIANAYLDHFSRYLGDMITSKRFAPLMKHYTLDELVQNMYIVKLNMISQNVWEKEKTDLEKHIDAYEKRTGVDFSDSFEWHKKTQELLLEHGSIYDKGVRKGLGKAPKMTGGKTIFKWGDTPKELKEDIQKFIKNELPKELINWWENIVKGGAEGARPPDLTEDPIDLFYFIAENDFIYPYGMELASVPETPLEPNYEDGEPIYDYTHSDFVKGSHEHSGTGQARMRLLTFDELVEEFGMDTALVYYFKSTTPSLERVSGRFISNETNEGMNQISNINYENRDILYEIDNIIDEWFRNYLKEERDTLEENIQEWIDEINRKYFDPESEEYDEEAVNEEKKKIWNKLREAVLRDNNYIYYSFPEEFDHTEYDYDEDFMLIIPDEIFDALKPIVQWAECIKLNLEKMRDVLNEYDYEDLEQDWDAVIPKIKDCGIENGELVFKTADDKDCEEIRKDRNEYLRLAELRLKEIKKLEEEKEVLIKSLEKCQENLRDLTEMKETFEVMEEEYAEEGKKIGMFKAEAERCEKELKEIQDKIGEKDKEIEECKKSLILFKEQNEILEKKIEESIMSEEEKEKILMELEKLKKETTEQIEALRKELELRKPEEEKERKRVSAVERYMKVKEKAEELEDEQMTDAIKILEGFMTGTEYQMKWGELPPSWDEMKLKIPLEKFYETRLIKELGEKILEEMNLEDQIEALEKHGSQKKAVRYLGREEWKDFTDEQKRNIIDAKMVEEVKIKETGFERVEAEKEWEERDKEELRAHLHEIYGEILPLREDVEEDYIDVVKNRPFKDWYAIPDITDDDIYNARIESYKEAIGKTIGETVRKIMGEKLQEMQDLYAKEYSRIKQLSEEEQRDQLDILQNEFNRYNKKLRSLRGY